MRESWVRYDNIEEKRQGYFVEYRPVFTGDKQAMLIINIYDPELVSEIKTIAEYELGAWAKRYATPIMVMVKNLTQSDWRIQDIVGHKFLLGYAVGNDVVAHWDQYPSSQEPQFDLSKERLTAIYSGLNNQTLEQVIEQQKEELKGRKLILLIMTFWFCVIPAFIAYLGWSSPFFSLLALFYSWYLATKKGLQLWGKKKKSQKELDEEKEKSQKEHHHYHCKLNPDGFHRLKCENFKKERLEREKGKIEEMRN
ncbi:hypothetical protein ABMY21_21200 [Vibrio vulnificus]|uniref:hypothetical protein n=1 Tax=Vibrio vulnificus TaxID=672 RepID=UPI0028CE5DFA|nr:hypothetical protein [Vibrio vulnificus]